MSYDPTFLDQGESEALFTYLCENTNLTSPAQIGDLTMDHGLHTFTNPELTGFDKLSELFGPRSVWTPKLQLVKERIRAITGHDLCVGRCIYYPDGNSGVEFHADLPAYGDTSCIASLSLGEEREFVIRRLSDQQTRSMVLASGSLLVMGENFQHDFQHSLPRSDRYKNPRINITFRSYGWATSQELRSP